MNLTVKATIYTLWCWHCDNDFTTEENVKEVKSINCPHCGGELDMSDVEIEDESASSEG